jgi:predicted fused transcriptional regulator/phosphomethylpyrimidine kinase/predicted transcriptional regulator
VNIMRPPCEFIQRDYLQTLRIVLAHELKDSGLSQSEISHKMSITQPAVNKYLGMSAEAGLIANAARSLADKLAQKILSSSPRDDELVKEICHTCMSLRIGSHICQLHRKNVPSLDDLNCQICSELLGGQEMDFTRKATVVSNMQEALILIESSSDFPKIIPQVRANLVACDDNASSISEVAGVPGRITLVGGRASAHMGPQFGASKHTASLLLWARSIWPHVTACFCISGSQAAIKSAKKERIKIFQTSSPAGNVDEIIKLAMLSIGKHRKKVKFPALHVPGGIGVEPILYVFGSNAISLSKICIKISEGL